MSLRRPPLFKRTSDATKLPLEPFTGPLVNSLTPLARADLWRSRARTNSAQLRSSYCRISAMDYSKTSPERIGAANGGSQPTMPHQVSSLIKDSLGNPIGRFSAAAHRSAFPPPMRATTDRLLLSGYLSTA